MKIDSFFQQFDFNKCSYEHGMYVKNMNNNILFICLYVDDLLVIGSNEEEIKGFKVKMKCEFEMIDLGLLSYFLRMEFKHTAKGLFMHQRKYVANMLQWFNMESYNTSQG